MDMKNIVIVGNGGFAKEVEFLISRINKDEPTWDFLGYIDNNTTGSHIVGDDQYLLNVKEELNVVIAIGNSHVRSRLYSLYRENEYLKFPNVIDPSVIISSKVEMGQGNIICAGTIITVDVTIGHFNIINLDCTIGHDVIIESYVTINPSVNVSGNVHVREETNIGTGSQIIQGKTVGARVVLGAGAVVTSDIEDDCVAVGVPAKIIKRK